MVLDMGPEWVGLEMSKVAMASRGKLKGFRRRSSKRSKLIFGNKIIVIVGTHFIFFVF